MNESTTTARFLELMRGGAGASTDVAPEKGASTPRDVDGASANPSSAPHDDVARTETVAGRTDAPRVEVDPPAIDTPIEASPRMDARSAETTSTDAAATVDRDTHATERQTSSPAITGNGEGSPAMDRAAAYGEMLRIANRDGVTLGTLNQRLGKRQSPGMKYVLQGERPPSDATLLTLSTALDVPLGFATDPKADTDMRHYVDMDATHLSDVLRERLRDVAAGGRGLEMDAVRRLQGIAPAAATPAGPEGTTATPPLARNEDPTPVGTRTAREFRREDAPERARLHAAVLRALVDDPRGLSTKFRAAHVGRENEKEIVAGTVAMSNAALDKFAAVYGIAHSLDLSGLAGPEERDSVLTAEAEAEAPAKASEAIAATAETVATAPREVTASEETPPSSPAANTDMSAPSPAGSDDDLIGRVVELVRRAADADARVAAAEAERDRMKGERDAMEVDLRNANDRLEALRRKVSEALG